jgi:hypothetical protein
MHSLDMVESSRSKRERRVTKGRNSPVRSTAPELNDSESAGPSGWGVALESSEPLGHAYGEIRGVRRLGTDEAAENNGGCYGHSVGADEMQRWPPFIAVYCIEATRACVRKEGGR